MLVACGSLIREVRQAARQPASKSNQGALIFSAVTQIIPNVHVSRRELSSVLHRLPASRSCSDIKTSTCCTRSGSHSFNAEATLLLFSPDQLTKIFMLERPYKENAHPSIEPPICYQTATRRGLGIIIVDTCLADEQ